MFSTKLDRDLRDIDECLTYKKPTDWEYRILHLMMEWGRYQQFLRANINYRFFKNRYARAAWFILSEAYDEGNCEYTYLYDKAVESGYTFMAQIIMEIFGYTPSSMPKNETIIDWCQKQKDKFMEEKLKDNLGAFGREKAIEADLKLDEEMKLNRHSNIELNMQNAMERQLKRHSERNESGLDGFSSFQWLNESVNGLKPRDLSIIAARPGGFKTATAMNIIMTAVQRDRKLKACFVNLEMSEGDMIDRFIQSYHHFTGKDVSSLDAGQYLARMNDVFGNGRIMCTDTKHIDIDELINNLDEYHEDGYRLFVIDYIQLIKTKEKYGTRDDLRICEAIQKLKEWKDKVKDSHIICLAQLKRIMGKNIPGMDDLKGSSSIEDAAAWIMIMYSDSEVMKKEDVKSKIKEKGPEEIYAYFAKNRHSQVGSLKIVVEKRNMRVFDAHEAETWRYENSEDFEKPKDMADDL